MPSQPSVRKFALVLALVGLVVAVPAPATARAPPRAACAVCTGALDAAAADHGVALERERSEMVVQVSANGSTRWTARVELAAGAERLANESLRDAVVADAMDRRYSVVDPDDVSTRLDGDTLAVSYRADDATTTRSGVLFFTAFHAADPANPLAMGGEGTAYVGADELVVRAPDGDAVVGSYGDATVTEDAVGWSGDAAGEASIDRSTRVAFASADDALSPLRVPFARLLLRV